MDSSLLHPSSSFPIMRSLSYPISPSSSSQRPFLSLPSQRKNPNSFVITCTAQMNDQKNPTKISKEKETKKLWGRKIRRGMSLTLWRYSRSRFRSIRLCTKCSPRPPGQLLCVTFGPTQQSSPSQPLMESSLLSSSSSSIMSSLSKNAYPIPPSSSTHRPFLSLLSQQKNPSSFVIRCTAQMNDQKDPTKISKVKEKKLWGGRFEEGVTDAVERFTESISFDKGLYKQDIMGSRAHAKMLAHQGLIADSDRDSILGGLDQIEKQIEAGNFRWRTDREDVHMNIEAALTDLVGEPAKKLHTARSRNDQVSTDFRLWCRDAIDSIVVCIQDLQVALVFLAKKNDGLIVPGYTHLQRAQPILLQHLLLAYVEQLERDAGRLLDCRTRLNFCPLGACTLAGTGLPINRFMTSDALSFTAPMRNSIDAVSDRDFVLEFLSANSITAIHLSRLGEEWVLWASEEFGFLTPSDSVSTGSSIMPQKKNPDPMELVRGKSARVVGDLVTLLVLCKGLPHAYNRDLQEDKEPLFDSVKTIIGMLQVSAEFAQNITFNRERIQNALPAGHLDATTLADYLVKKEIPFRTSHDIVGRSVALCISRKCQLQDLSLDDLRSISPAFDADVYEYLGVENGIKKFISYGSTGSECVASQLDYWITRLNIDKTQTIDKCSKKNFNAKSF